MTLKKYQTLMLLLKMYYLQTIEIQLKMQMMLAK